MCKENCNGCENCNCEHEGLVDNAIEYIKTLQKRENDMAEPCVNEILGIFKKNIEAESDFSVPTALNVLSICLIQVAGALCKDEEEFKDELKKADILAKNNFIACLDDLKVEYDNEEEKAKNYNMSRLMMALGRTVENVLAVSIFNRYADIRAQMEENEAKQIKAKEGDVNDTTNN